MAAVVDGDHAVKMNGMERIPRPFVIGVAGGTASGKSSVCDKIMSQLGQDDVDRKQRRVAIINQDSFYKTLNEEEKKKALKGEFNFDHPANKLFRMAAVGDGDHAVKMNGMERIPRPFVIGVAGGTASGKSSVCDKIMSQLGQDDVDRKQRRVAIINQDSFYKTLNEEEKKKALRGEFNFDHPDAFDWERMKNTINDVIKCKKVMIPHYNYVENKSDENCHPVYPADVVLFEGILVFSDKEVRDKFHMKLFVDTDPDTRLSRRVLRDTRERGRDIEQILHQYTTLVKPAFEEFCLPTKKYADVIIPRGADNTVAIDLIVQHIQELLRPTKNSVKRFRHNSDSFVGRPH